jgi:hypothetical protein
LTVLIRDLVFILEQHICFMMTRLDAEL